MSDGSDLEFEPSADQRRIAAQQYEHARQAINSGNFDYGIELLQSCCKLDPANLIYRKTLRATEKTKYKNNMRGGFFSSVRTGPQKAKVKSAKQKEKLSERELALLEHGVRAWVEEILALPPDWEYDPGVAWDEIGIDMLVIDEAAAFKNLYKPQAREDGVPKFMGGGGEGSDRAWQLDFRAASVRRQTGGAGIVQDPESLFMEGWMMCYVGAYDVGFERMRRAIAGGYWPASTLERSMHLDALRGEPRFEQLVQEAVERNRQARAAFHEADGGRLLGV